MHRAARSAANGRLSPYRTEASAAGRPPPLNSRPSPRRLSRPPAARCLRQAGESTGVAVQHRVHLSYDMHSKGQNGGVDMREPVAARTVDLFYNPAEMPDSVTPAQTVAERLYECRRKQPFDITAGQTVQEHFCKRPAGQDMPWCSDGSLAGNRDGRAKSPNDASERAFVRAVVVAQPADSMDNSPG